MNLPSKSKSQFPEPQGIKASDILELQDVNILLLRGLLSKAENSRLKADWQPLLAYSTNQVYWLSSMLMTSTEVFRFPHHTALRTHVCFFTTLASVPQDAWHTDAEQLFAE